MFFITNDVRSRVGLGLVVACLLCVASLILTAGLWRSWIGRALVCDEQLGASDAILVENFDPEYLLFERAAAIVKAGLASRILVPGEASVELDIPNPVSEGFVEVMARVAHLDHVTYIPVREQEPIVFGVAHQVRSFLAKNGIRSVILISPGFRSRRSFLVHKAVLGEIGVSVRCVPVFNRSATPETWSRSWHGVQSVVEQFAKLQYYRFYVLPFSSFAESEGRRAATGHEIWLK